MSLSKASFLNLKLKQKTYFIGIKSNN